MVALGGIVLNKSSTSASSCSLVMMYVPIYKRCSASLRRDAPALQADEAEGWPYGCLRFGGNRLPLFFDFYMIETSGRESVRHYSTRMLVPQAPDLHDW